jgi:hypothetical protein
MSAPSIARVRMYLAARRAKPMPQLGDAIHTVNAGSEYEGNLLLSDLYVLSKSHADLSEALAAALDWIDAVPDDVLLPAMPGFDRDEVDEVLAKASSK